jgi:transcriptional regulator with GAF, ATPase, and Fis domain
VLQRGEFERLGGSQTHRADVRVIAATNRDLGELVEQGRFRADLFYRLNVFPIYVPPLRERIAEIIPLVNHFVQRFRIQFRKNITAITRESLDRLQSYSWPGNIRELEHLIERAILLANGEVLTIELSPSKAHLPPGKTHASPEKALLPLSELEREYFERVLQSTGGAIEGKGGAAEVLKLNPSTLRSRLKKLGVPYGARHRTVGS